MNTIFVQIASYKDPELLPTLEDLVTKADNPENLHACVCWQHGNEQTIEDFLDKGYDIEEVDVETNPIFDIITLSYKDAKITLLDVDYIKTKGACWARHAIQQFYDDEKYTLQLDSHHRFVDGWDTLAIGMLEGLRDDGHEKPLLTAYIPSYDPQNDPEKRVQTPWRMNFDRFIPEGAVFFIPSTMDGWEDMDSPMPSRFFSAHFCFADGKFAVEVQHDPEYFFHGEEISIAVRAFTHGYDLFHPHRVIAWHEYTREGRTKVWDDHTAETKQTGVIDLDWHERNLLCHKRNRILFGMDGEDPNQIDFGKYGFGDKRTVREYEEYAGISFKYRGVQQHTIDQNPPPNNIEYETEEEWKNSFVRSNDVRIYIPKDEFGEFLDDYTFFYVGVHDKDGKELHRKDLTEKEVYDKLRHTNALDFQFIWLGDGDPASYTVWPHSKTKGWINKVTKQI